MIKWYTLATLLLCFFTLVSFSSNPPEGMTGAPGESFCTECHSQTNPPQQGFITVLGFPDAITPNQTYPLTVVVENTTADAVKAGFQMTILTPLNTKAGNMTNPSANSTLSNFLGRQYFEHNPSVAFNDSSRVSWTVDWTAPDLPAGSAIRWFASGNIANGNFENTGDRIVGANGSGTIVLSGINEPQVASLNVFPNPGRDVISITLPDGRSANGRSEWFDISGVQVASVMIENGRAEVPDLQAGVYVIRMVQDHIQYRVLWTAL